MFRNKDGELSLILNGNFRLCQFGREILRARRIAFLSLDGKKAATNGIAGFKSYLKCRQMAEFLFDFIQI